MKEINPKQLRADLIELYTSYVEQDKEFYEQQAKNLDGVWAGSFLLPKEIEKAIDAVSFLYLHPRMTQEQAQEILKALKNNNPVSKT